MICSREYCYLSCITVCCWNVCRRFNLFTKNRSRNEKENNYSAVRLTGWMVETTTDDTAIWFGNRMQCDNTVGWYKDVQQPHQQYGWSLIVQTQFLLIFIRIFKNCEWTSVAPLPWQQIQQIRWQAEWKTKSKKVPTWIPILRHPRFCYFFYCIESSYGCIKTVVLIDDAY